MDQIIEILNSLILPVVTVILGYFGWRANAEKNRLKAELRGVEESNISKEIENQSSWIDLYKKLADDQAARINEAMGKILKLEQTISRLEDALNQTKNCAYYENCPVRKSLKDAKRRRPASDGIEPESNTNQTHGVPATDKSEN